MILNDVVELCKAGFSKEEILKMINPAPAQAQAQAQAPAKAQAQAQAPAKAQAQAPAQAQAQAKAQAQAPAQAQAQAPAVDNLVETVNKLISTLQANAILNSRQQPPETPEDIFANLIAPPAKKEGGIK